MSISRAAMPDKMVKSAVLRAFLPDTMVDLAT